MSLLALFIVAGVLVMFRQLDSEVSVQPQVLASTVTSIDPKENGLIAQINSIRSDAGVPELTYSFGLKDLATFRVSDMALREYYSHISPEGYTYANYLGEHGSDSTYSCENLQLQVGSDDVSVVKAWTTSPAHYRCLIDPRISNIAISYDVHSEVSSAHSGSVDQMYIFAMIASN